MDCNKDTVGGKGTPGLQLVGTPANLGHKSHHDPEKWPCEGLIICSLNIKKSKKHLFLIPELCLHQIVTVSQHPDKPLTAKKDELYGSHIQQRSPVPTVFGTTRKQEPQFIKSMFASTYCWSELQLDAWRHQ